MTFDKVEIKGVRRWKDAETGKPRQATKVFMQTVNPFNKNADGLPKSRAESMAEIVAERDKWIKGTQ